jgi:hypothetical protein
MPNPYRDIWNHNGMNAAAQTLTLPQRLQNPPRDACDGTTILTIADANAGGQADFNALFHAYIDYGNNVRHWIWNGAGGGWDRCGLLDGARATGECKLFVCNLWLLARSPRPYGLGIVATQIPDTLQYAGVGGHGFVSTHNGTFYGLHPNVSPAPNASSVPLYLWLNHKVISYQGRYWDPCYRATYAQLQDMAMYQLTGRTFRLRNAISNNCAQTGDTAEEATCRGVTYFFRLHSAPEQAMHQRLWEGPLTQQQALARHNYLTHP